MRPPIFILGNPRSGTTLLRLMLTCHPEIVVPPECGFLVWLYPEYGSWSAPSAASLTDRFAADVMACRKIETWQLSEEALTRLLRRRRPATYAEAAALVYELYGRARGASFNRWGDKNNYYIHHIPTLDALFPAASFVHIVRDARNVVCSYKGLHAQKLEARYAPRLPFATAEAARQWRDNVEGVRSALSGMAAERVCELRFEDLIADPEGVLRRLCAALGERYDPRMLRYHQLNRQQRLEPEELLAWKGKTLEPPLPAEIDRYSRELSASEIATIEGIAGDTLRHYGYLP